MVSPSHHKWWLHMITTVNHISTHRGHWIYLQNARNVVHHGTIKGKIPMKLLCFHCYRSSQDINWNSFISSYIATKAMLNHHKQCNECEPWFSNCTSSKFFNFQLFCQQILHYHLLSFQLIRDEGIIIGRFRPFGNLNVNVSLLIRQWLLVNISQRWHNAE